jgi:hypothetical protein
VGVGLPLFSLWPPLIKPLSSAAPHQPFVIRRPSSTLCHPPPLIKPLSSFAPHQTFVIRRPYQTFVILREAEDLLFFQRAMNTRASH